MILSQILKKAAQIRMVEQRIVAHYPEQKMRCPTHLCLGQEMVPAVFGHYALVEDVFVGTYRSHGHYLAKHGDLTAMFAELLGSTKGCSGGFGGSMHLVDVPNNFIGTTAIVAAGVPIAAGAAMALQCAGQKAAAVTFTGDAALEEGIYYETVNYACLHKLPVIFVCENNGLAIATPLSLRQASMVLHKRFESLGIKSFHVAENDHVGMMEAARLAYEHARSGQGPVFIECVVNRRSVHVGHDVSGDMEGWWQSPLDAKQKDCPLSLLVRDILKKNEMTLPQIQKMREELLQTIEAAYKRAEAEYTTTSEPLEDFVYASGLTSQLPDTSALQKTQFSAIEPSKLVNPF